MTAEQQPTKSQQDEIERLERDVKEIDSLYSYECSQVTKLRAALEHYAQSDMCDQTIAREALRGAECLWVEVTHGQFRPGCGVERFTTTWRDPLVKFCEYCGKTLQWPADKTEAAK